MTTQLTPVVYACVGEFVRRERKVRGVTESATTTVAAPGSLPAIAVSADW